MTVLRTGSHVALYVVNDTCLQSKPLWGMWRPAQTRCLNASETARAEQHRQVLATIPRESHRGEAVWAALEYALEAFIQAVRVLTGINLGFLRTAANLLLVTVRMMSRSTTGLAYLSEVLANVLHACAAALDTVAHR